MSGWTKGPWIAEGSRIVSEGNRNLTIARVGVAPDGDYNDANTSLLAAAPELATACEAAMMHMKWTTDLGHVAYMQLSAALRKARGEG